MFPNLMLDSQELQRLTDERRRDLAAQWGRPPVPRVLREASPPGRALVRRALDSWLRRRPDRSAQAAPTTTAC